MFHHRLVLSLVLPGTMAKRQHNFVVASPFPSCPATLNAQAPDGLTFSYARSRFAPFAWIGGSQQGHVPPLARMANRTVHLTSDDASLLQSLLSDNVEEQRKAPQKRGHSDEWYQERCVFCCSCKGSINSQFHKRGSRCHGCRRWCHNTCMPDNKHSSNSSIGTGQQQQAAAAAANMSGEQLAGGGSSSGTQGSVMVAAAEAVQESQQSKEHKQSHGLFFHTDECAQAYKSLAAVAAAGEQPMPAPTKRGFMLPWQQQPQQQQLVWRLLDLSDIRHLYKDAQKRGTLFKQHAKVQQQLAQHHLQQQTAGSSANGSNQQQQQQGLRTPAVHSRLDDFLYVCELMSDMGDTPKDLLEDSFALLTRNGSGVPTCVATFNIYGRDHARLQGLATPKALHCQGHASRLVRQLELVLTGAGLKHLAVVVEPEAQDARACRAGVPDATALERWLGRMGYRAAEAEQAMMWRRELPEYHKNLMAGCTLLVKPLSSSRKGWLW